MFCTVHALYKAGVRLPADEARSNGVYGWLYLCHRGLMAPSHELIAHFSEHDGPAARALLAALWYPQIRLVKGGILLAGREMLDSVYSQHQRWWCVPSAARSSSPTT